MAATSAVERSRTYSSYSGAEIKIVINGAYYGQAQAMSHAIQREKVPTYVLGSPDPLAFSRGKRGIAGTIVSLVLGQDPIYTDPFASMQFLARNDELVFSVADALDATDQNTIGLVDSSADPLDPAATFDATDLSTNYTVMNAWYMDQLPPMDAVIIAVSEHGNAASSRVVGIEFLNTASGFSVDDSSIEKQATYVCTGIVGWKKVAEVDWAAANPKLSGLGT